MSDDGKSPKREPMSDDDDERDRRPERRVSRSRSRSRSRSPRGRSRSRSPMAADRSRSPPRDEDAKTESMNVGDADAAFVLGRGGSTKLKIARVSGARLDLQDRDGRLDIFGTATARARAKDYVGYVLTQRTGPVFIDTTEKRDDLSIVNVPEVSNSHINNNNNNNNNNNRDHNHHRNHNNNHNHSHSHSRRDDDVSANVDVDANDVCVCTLAAVVARAVSSCFADLAAARHPSHAFLVAPPPLSSPPLRSSSLSTLSAAMLTV